MLLQSQRGNCFTFGVGHFLSPPGSPRRFAGQLYPEFYSCLCFVVVVVELMEERFYVGVIDRPFNQAEVVGNNR